MSSESWRVLSNRWMLDDRYGNHRLAASRRRHRQVGSAVNCGCSGPNLRVVGIGFTALDNGFAAVDDPAAVQAICDRLGPEQIHALLDKWLAILPAAFTDADRAAGYRYECSIPQAEFSLTQVLDRPVSGRVFFEQVIRDNLDAGRPDQVSLIFDRRV